MQTKHAVDGGSGPHREDQRPPVVSDELIQRANAAYLAAWRPSWWARQFFARSSRFEDWPEEVRREHLNCIRAALAAAFDPDREIDTSVG